MWLVFFRLIGSHHFYPFFLFECLKGLFFFFNVLGPQSLFGLQRDKNKESSI